MELSCLSLCVSPNLKNMYVQKFTSKLWPMSLWGSLSYTSIFSKLFDRITCWMDKARVNYVEKGVPILFGPQVTHHCCNLAWEEHYWLNPRSVYFNLKICTECVQYEQKFKQETSRMKGTQGWILTIFSPIYIIFYMPQSKWPLLT